jgi:hypothetical protein
MAQKIWKVPGPAGESTVELEHGTGLGGRRLKVDGKNVPLLGNGIRLFDRGSDHTFTIGDQPAEIQIRPRGLGAWHYLLKVNGQAFDEPLPTARFPLWGFWFVAATWAPALLLLRNGVSPVALLIAAGVCMGGAVGVVAIASDPLPPTDQKVMRCIGMALFIWAVTALPGLMMAGAIAFLNVAS